MTSLAILTLLCALFLTTTIWADVVVSPAAAAREAEAAQQLAGPAAPPEETEAVGEIGQKGTSLGMFTTTGYCSGPCCGGGSGLTYSGTVPQPNHTVSADLDRFPIGTKLMINDIIYTVEDMGSAVKGNCVDIFYSTHDEALEHGRKTEEVFSVIYE